MMNNTNYQKDKIIKRYSILIAILSIICFVLGFGLIILYLLYYGGFRFHN
jgi:hypothetical protein